MTRPVPDPEVDCAELNERRKLVSVDEYRVHSDVRWTLTVKVWSLLRDRAATTCILTGGNLQVRGGLCLRDTRRQSRGHPR